MAYVQHCLREIRMQERFRGRARFRSSMWRWTQVWQSGTDRKSTRLNSSHSQISYAVFCLKKKKNDDIYVTDAFYSYLHVSWRIAVAEHNCGLSGFLGAGHTLSYADHAAMLQVTHQYRPAV